MFIFKPRNYFIDFITKIKTAQEKDGEPETGFGNIVVVEPTSDTLCPAKYKHCSNIVPTMDPELATKLSDGSATMYPDGSVSSTGFFPARNVSDLALRLSAALDLLNPFLCRLDEERSKALESTRDRAWHLDITKSRTFLRASDANYFQVRTLSPIPKYCIFLIFTKILCALNVWPYFKANVTFTFHSM